MTALLLVLAAAVGVAAGWTVMPAVALAAVAVILIRPAVIRR